jgi:hypothetical protein
VKAWLPVYALILATMIALFFLVNGLEHRRAQETISPAPTARTTIGAPETTTPRPTP